ncbi:glycosyltransferase family 2 protein [soil metagenome]
MSPKELAPARIAAPGEKIGDEWLKAGNADRPAERNVTLSVSLVVYQPDLALLRATMSSLERAIRYAREQRALREVTVWLVDNGSPDAGAVDRVFREEVELLEGLRFEVIRGQGNVGYGQGHNLAIRNAGSDYHLVLNPDVVLDETALLSAVAFMEVHPDVGLLTPWAQDDAGTRHYICREYPSVFVLFLRGFAPAGMRRRWEHRLTIYELRDRIGAEVVKGVPTASGCFMFTRRELLQRLGGFSDRYFMYFEDTDLSLRLSREAAIAYVPSVRIVHAGGGAARKGLRHVRMFCRSAWTFFRTHRWKLT